jgi:hypothetical protein
LAREKEKLTRQSVWTCCLVAFWGAFRLGELLGKSEKIFDKFSDLQWGTLSLEKVMKLFCFQFLTLGIAR